MGSFDPYHCLQTHSKHASLGLNHVHDGSFYILLAQDTLKIHYENNNPFLTISSITRTIEVSHWGNIAVEETIDLRHTGAVLKGPFSRYDYQRQSDSGISSVKSFKVCWLKVISLVLH